MAKYALINMQGQILKTDIEWDGKLVQGLYAHIDKDYLLAAELWPQAHAEEIADSLKATQRAKQIADDQHMTNVYRLRNKFRHPN